MELSRHGRATCFKGHVASVLSLSEACVTWMGRIRDVWRVSVLLKMLVWTDFATAAASDSHLATEVSAPQVVRVRGRSPDRERSGSIVDKTVLFALMITSQSPDPVSVSSRRGNVDCHQSLQAPHPTVPKKQQMSRPIVQE